MVAVQQSTVSCLDNAVQCSRLSQLCVFYVQEYNTETINMLHATVASDELPPASITTFLL